MAHDYYYGKEADRFQFIRIPKALLLDAEYKKMSSDAKILYALFLDRMGLSIVNGWVDEENRVYINYSQAAIMQALSCGTEKASKIVKELVSFDLIKKERLGLGKQDRIYVLNFESGNNTVTEEYRDAAAVAADDRDSKIESPEIRKSNYSKFGNRITGNSETESPEIRKSNTNNTDNSQTDNNQTVLPSFIPDQEERQTDGRNETPKKTVKADDEKPDSYRDAVARIKENINYRGICTVNERYDVLLREKKISLDHYEREHIGVPYLDRMIEYMADACIVEGSVKIKGQELPAEKVRERLFRINQNKMLEAYRKLRSVEDVEGIKNRRQYILSTLYDL